VSALTAARPDLATAVGRGLAGRLAQRLRTLDRLDALEGRSGALPSEELRDDPVARELVARELVARLLQVASDARLAPIVRALVAGGARTSATLAAMTGVPRVALARRLDDLVDVGLAERDPSADTAAPTPLAAALAELLDALASATAAALIDALTAATASALGDAAPEAH